MMPKIFTKIIIAGLFLCRKKVPYNQSIYQLRIFVINIVKYSTNIKYKFETIKNIKSKVIRR